MKSKILKIAFIIFVGAFTLGFGIGAVTEFSLSKDYVNVYEVYTVKQGDTFMDICLEYRKRDCRDPYIFEYMDEIRRFNPQVVEKENLLNVGDELNIRYKIEK